MFRMLESFTGDTAVFNGVFMGIVKDSSSCTGVDLVVCLNDVWGRNRALKTDEGCW